MSALPQWRHPLIEALVGEIPKCEGYLNYGYTTPQWTPDEREKWLTLARSILDRVYGEAKP